MRLGVVGQWLAKSRQGRPGGLLADPVHEHDPPGGDLIVAGHRMIGRRNHGMDHRFVDLLMMSPAGPTVIPAPHKHRRHGRSARPRHGHTHQPGEDAKRRRRAASRRRIALRSLTPGADGGLANTLPQRRSRTVPFRARCPAWRRRWKVGQLREASGSSGLPRNIAAVAKQLVRCDRDHSRPPIERVTVDTLTPPAHLQHSGSVLYRGDWSSDCALHRRRPGRRGRRLGRR
jgi:hypothetical protein